MKSKAARILAHIVGCIAFLSLPMLLSPDLPLGVSIFSVKPFIKDLSFHFLLICFFYLNYFVLTPRYFFTGKYLVFTLIVLAAFVVAFFAPDLFLHPRPGPPPGGLHPHPPGGPPPFSREVANRLFIFLVAGFFSLVLRLNKQWIEVQQEKRASELSSLKAQINPHFLFNTLNSIYSLAITKSDETPAAIVKLSGMMRYVISEASAEYVPLEKEISYISDYIHLQRLRLGETVKIIYETTGDPLRKEIVPLLIIPFVENAFKHGVNPEEDSEIRIKISISDDEISILIRNNKLKEIVQGSTGIGNETTINRLKLSYPNRHILQITDNDAYFSVHLTIRLK